MSRQVRPPKFLPERQWSGLQFKPWPKRDKKNAIVMFNFVERLKSFFFKCYFDRNGYRALDMGDHVKEDVRLGKEYGNRMECNPMYFTSGSMLRNLFEIERQTGLSRAEIARRYIFLCGGGQCGPCRYGMYPQEYMKVANDTGFTDLRVLIFSSDLAQTQAYKGSALPFNLMFRINLVVSIMLADLVHLAECAIRPYAVDGAEVDRVIAAVEELIRKTFLSKLWLFKMPRALRRAGEMLAAVPRRDLDLPLIFVTGEFFANLAHNDGNYHLRRFITDEGCEVIPGNLTQRVLYDNWRRSTEARRGIKYAKSKEERKHWEYSLGKQQRSTKVINWFWRKYTEALNPQAFGGRAELMDLQELADLARELYHPEIFGGEGNLEIAEALHLAGKVDGFISSKPFGCMPSSGVSDGVQAKVLSLYPELNFLSIETSGDNDVNILSRVSMTLFKAKQKVAARRDRSLREARMAAAGDRQRPAGDEGRSDDDGTDGDVEDRRAS
jgi:predicted nucleotide-binding protein (sugar kinase/HSP70/actin superfamily)